MKKIIVVLFLLCVKLHAVDDLLESSYPFFIKEESDIDSMGNLYIGSHPFEKTITLTDKILLNIVSKYPFSKGLVLGLNDMNRHDHIAISWKNGIFPSLQSLPKVKSLTIESKFPKDFFNEISNEDSYHVRSNIEVFQSCKTTIDFQKLFYGFPNLKKAVFRKTKFEDLTPIQNNNIKEIRLWDTKIKNEVLQVFTSSFPNLKSIRIAECDFNPLNSQRINDTSMEILTQLDFIEEISVLTSSDEKFVSSDFPDELLSPIFYEDYSPTLKLAITDEGLATLGHKAPQLRHLRLGKLPNVTDIGIFEIPQNLEILHLEGLSSQFTDEGFRHILTLPKLEELTLGGYRSFSAEIKHPYIIRYHTPIFCSISGNVFEEIMNTTIKKLHLLYWDNITDQDLLSIRNNLPNLEQLRLTNCPKISKLGIKALQNENPNLKIEVLKQPLGKCDSFLMGY